MGRGRGGFRIWQGAGRLESWLEVMVRSVSCFVFEAAFLWAGKGKAVRGYGFGFRLGQCIGEVRSVRCCGTGDEKEEQTGQLCISMVHMPVHDATEQEG